MRIISGRLKGLSFDSPKGHRTHPMSEKIRGAIFNALGDVSGLTFFDAFAGSGAIGFEAVSRGAKSVLAADSSKEAHTALRSNIEHLGLEKEVKLVRANVSGWSDNNRTALFDVVSADPPFDDLQEVVLEKIAKHVKLNGLYVLNLPPKARVVLPDFELIRQKDHGDAVLSFYRRLV